MDNLHQHQRIFENADLIVKHLKGKLTPHEQEMLNEWLEEDKRNRQFLETLSDESAFRKELQFLSSVDVSSAWEKVSRYTSQQRKTKLWEYIIKWKYAAMLSFFITVACMFYIRYDNETKPFAAGQSDQNYTNDVLPGGDKALLELSDGTVLILEQVDDGSLQQQGETHLVKQDGQLVYNAAQRNQSEEIFYNKISTPKGGQYQVILPDGSKVWLNAGSSLRFPTAFTGKERQVELTGEAYFEIAKITTLSSSGSDKQRMPFKVKTDKANVEVLGTHFNVMAYAEEGSVNTTLLEGSVKVSQPANQSSKILKPGQQAKVNGSIHLVNVDTEEVVAWKNGFFQFNAADIKTVMGQIKRWYDVEIDYVGEMPSKHFTGVISRNNNVSKVLGMLELTGAIRFEIRGKKISVINK